MICPACTLWFCDNPRCKRIVAVRNNDQYKATKRNYYLTKMKPARAAIMKTEEQCEEELKKDLLAILLKLGEGDAEDSS